MPLPSGSSPSSVFFIAIGFGVLSRCAGVRPGVRGLDLPGRPGGLFAVRSSGHLDAARRLPDQAHRPREHGDRRERPARGDDRLIGFSTATPAFCSGAGWAASGRRCTGVLDGAGLQGGAAAPAGEGPTPSTGGGFVLGGMAGRRWAGCSAGSASIPVLLLRRHAHLRGGGHAGLPAEDRAAEPEQGAASRLTRCATSPATHGSGPRWR